MAAQSDALTREEEKALVGRVRAGDERATRDLVDLHKDRLFAFIWRIIRNHHDAEEVCQDAFLKAFASLASFSTEYRFSTWLFTIAYRVCLNQMRRKRPLTGELDFESLERCTDAPDSPEAAVVQTEEAQQLKQVVWSAVDELSTPQRVAVLLFYRYSQSCQDIAQVLELPVATVKSHLHRARARLRGTLESQICTDSSRFRSLRAVGG